MGRPAGYASPRAHNLDWQRDAACNNNPAFLNEPEDGGWTDRQRITLCTGTIKGEVIDPPCPVRQQCLEYALSLPISDLQHRGLVYGGYTGQQIARKIRDNRKAAT